MTAHPAKFSAPIVVKIRELLAEYLPRPAVILDPFAGVGGVHHLAVPGSRWTVGVEIEREWASQHPGTLVGDSRFLPFAGRSFDAIVTSCTYGNRMADHHNAQERCKPCKGTGEAEVMAPGGLVLGKIACPKCEGEGRRAYKRLTYRHQLDRELTPGNSGGMQWGESYRELHRAVYAECRRVVVDGGLFVLNVSNHIRKRNEVDVTSWHLEALRRKGFPEVVAVERVETARMGFGANREARVPFETVAVLR